MTALTQNALESLSVTRLQQLVAAAEVQAADRRSKASLIEALANVPLLDMAHTLTVPDLKAICVKLGLESKGPKPTLVARIAQAVGGDVMNAAQEPRAQSVRDSGTVKSALRRFALEAAGGYRGKDAATKFVTALLECFGWPKGRPADAQIPANLRVAEHGRHSTRQVAVLWNERRALIEVTGQDTALDSAWKDLLGVCLQLDPMPQFVVLTNQRDLRLYDLARDRAAARLSTSIDDLAKHSEALPFLSESWQPGATPKIPNTTKVSREVADLVARLYRSLKTQHSKREDDVIQFTLQCIITMFAEDIGLLPEQHFTTLLYEGARQRDTDKRLRELFRQMGSKDVRRPPAVAYFNGGLFKDPVTLSLGDEQLAALMKAAESNWKYVDPHIFGSVFQGIMGDDERHATGAHYTAHEDIMRVVGPSIVDPWRKRIQDAKTLAELLSLRAELFKFRVLDPACGSGNFLYVSFREMYALDTYLLGRIREFPSAKDPLKSVAWTVGIPATNFYGIDTNKFAVELAKVTLNIAKKIAFEERKAKVAAFTSQLEIDVEPSLPLDNLDDNIVCADALFAEWPRVNAIVGNPPFLGGLKIRNEIGPIYLEKLQERYPTVNGRADLCAYWFRRAHDHLAEGARAGLVATNTIREGNTREAATDYILQNGGTITNAVSSQRWPGESVVNVSMVNWVKGSAISEPRCLVVDGVFYEPKTIPASLQLSVDLASATSIAANSRGTSQGLVLGTKQFQFGESVALELFADARARPFIKPVAVASHLLAGQLADKPEYVLDMSRCDSENEAKKGGAAFEYLKKHVFPLVREKATTATTDHYKNWLKTWWRPFWPRIEFLAETDSLDRVIACSRHAARPVFVFLSRRFFPTESLQLFAFDDDYTFGVLQSNLHWRWAVALGSKIKDDTRYTSEIWSTFPWPQAPTTEAIARVARAGRALRIVRSHLMKENGWTLRQLHQAAEVPSGHPLKDAQSAINDAVSDAYGIPPEQDTMEFLLELNRCLVEDEEQGRNVNGPGLPDGLSRKDPRWFSTDCIEARPLQRER